MSSIVERARKAKKQTEERLSRGGDGSASARFWKPEAGENKIRIMPPWTDDELFASQFWREVAQHWRVTEEQRGPVLCPKHTPGLEGDCPICEFVDELKRDKTQVDAQKLAREVKAKVTYLLNVISHKDPVYTVNDVTDYMQSNPDRECPFEVNQPKVQIYACPVSVFDDILGLIASSGEDITSLETGRNLVIKKIPNKDVFKTRYQVMPDFAASEFGNADKLKLPALDQFGFRLEYDAMLDLLQGGVGGSFAALSKPVAAKVLPTPQETAVDLEEEMRRQLAGR